MGTLVAGDEKWPAEAEEAYDRVRPLGKGAFGLVWLAKAKKDGSDDGDDDLVAVKFIKISSDIEHSYADREIAILSELRHPCVIHLVRAFEQDPSTNSRLVVMSLAAGPDVGKLIETGGALSLPLCRLLARHLTSAVGYLHGRGVVHRDIKPDNCILVRAKSSSDGEADDILRDDSLWDQKLPDTEDLAPKFKAVLVDFGFAKALTPTDFGQKPSEGKQASLRQFKRSSQINLKPLTEEDLLAADDKQEGTGNGNGNGHAAAPPPRGRRSSVFRMTKTESVARIRVGRMSVVGTRAFAAPEIMQAREKTDAEKVIGAAGGNVGLTDAISDYGMVSDAFSVGATLRTALTGAPPNEPDINRWISHEKQLQPPAPGSGGLCCKTAEAVVDPSQPRRRQFRLTFNVPKEIDEFVGGLVNPNTEERLTVRKAKLHPWICGRDNEAQYDLPEGDIPARTGDPIVFLKCAKDFGNA